MGRIPNSRFQGIGSGDRSAGTGDSSAATRWTVDQEIVGSNPTHGGNLISVARSISGFTQPIR